ncbi:MAG TPA: hypothetical protein VIA02_05530, partial [Candidatus Limnocylindria bacterium]
LVERDLDLEAELTRARREAAELEALAEPATAPSEPGDAEAGRHRAVAIDAEAAWRAALDRSRSAADAVVAAEEALATVRLREADRLADAGRRAEEVAAGRARRDRLEAELAAIEERLSAATVEAERAAADRRAAEEALEAAERRAREAAERRSTAEAQAGRAAVGVAELGERRARVTAELSELEAALPDGASDIVDRLRSGGWSAPESLEAVPAGAGAAVAAVLGDVERALLWKPGADPVVTDVAGDALLLAPANGRPAGRGEALAAVGGTQTLAELIDGAAAPEVLQRTVVAPSLASLLAGWHELPDGWAAVTLDGDLADARGLVTVRGRAGSAGRPVGRRAAMTELAALAERLAAEIEAATAELAHARTELEQSGVAADAAVAAVEAARTSRRQADDHALTSDAAVAGLTAERERLTAALADLPATAESPDGPPDALRTELGELEATAAAARERQATADAERDAARKAWQAAVRIADEHDAMSGDRRAGAARTAERTDQLSRAIARVEAERAGLAAGLAEASTALAEARTAEAAAIEARTAAEEAREAARVALLDAERRLSGGGGRLAELEGQQNQVAVEVSRLEEALAGLERERELSLEGLPEVDPAAEPSAESPAEAPAPSALGEDDLAEELRRTRRTLHQIGSVNPFAIEEHRELSARLGELSEQETDLKGATESTQELIDRLDQEISQQFQVAFAAIGEKFDEYCRLLFAGGSASLELSQDEDSEAPGGIEIAVRPPGKRLQRLAMLSGGERALAGVALLFAMLTVNPVPFCVLDEVDAALDEANIGRFADALRRLAETIDFVVITHNRATIETADTIYGVTMTDAAVSRVLSLKLADVPVEVPA